MVALLNQSICTIIMYCRTIKITLGAVEKCDVMLILSYVVSNASWTPAYDIRVFTKDKSMKVYTVCYYN